MSKDEAIPVDRLIKIYVKMRDKCVELTKEQDAVEEQMEMIKAQLLEVCQATGVNSLSTPFGRLTRSLRTRYTTYDWESMYAFIKANEVPELLEKRIHQSNMKTFLEDNKDKHPPGLNSDSEYSVIVYRK